jgi:hypothetical protein
MHEIYTRIYYFSIGNIPSHKKYIQMNGLTSLNSHGKYSQPQEVLSVYTQPQELYPTQGIYTASGIISHHREDIQPQEIINSKQEIYPTTGNTYSHSKYIQQQEINSATRNNSSHRK